MKWFQSQGVPPTEITNVVLRRYIDNLGCDKAKAYICPIWEQIG